MHPTAHLSIGQLAKSTGCDVQTIRCYEQQGLIAPAGRTAGNQRFYDQAECDRLSFIRHSRDLGFSLDQIRTILALQDQPHQSCEAVDAVARAHLAEVESKITRLTNLRDELQRMVQSCGGGEVADCRIVQVLADHSLCQVHASKEMRGDQAKESLNESVTAIPAP